MRGPPIFFPCNSFKKNKNLQRRLFWFFIPGVNSKNKSFVRKIARICGQKKLNKKILAGC
jgi:hypothetical protein